MDCAEQLEPLGGHPILLAGSLCREGAMLKPQVIEEFTPISSRRMLLRTDN
jgi:hypothetical protein